MGDAIALTHAGVNMSGKQESSTQTIHPDGKEHPVAQAPGIMVVTRWVGSRMLELKATKDGAVLGQGTYEVSTDGHTLTATVQGTDAAGAPFEQVIVFDRE